MRTLVAALPLAAVLAACSRPSQANPAAGSASPLPTENLSLTGKVVERLDEAPYCYLRLETPAGPAWTAVPATSRVEAGNVVTVVNGSSVNDVELRTLGRRLSAVVFGTLKRD